MRIDVDLCIFNSYYGFMAAKRGIDHSDVMAAGLSVLDRHGLSGVSLRAIADLCKVQPPSLYSHVNGLNGLLDDLALTCIDEFGARLRDSAVGVAGDDAIRSFAAAYRNWANTYPGRYELTLRSIAPGARRDAGRGAMDTMGSVLAHYGLSDSDARRTGRALRAALHGFVTLEAADALGRSDRNASFDALIAVFLDALRRQQGSTAATTSGT